ncbi:MAG: hypothetical protein ACHP9V_05850 [Terriglobales bacterium]
MMPLSDDDMRHIEIAASIAALTTLMVHAELSDTALKAVITRLKMLRKEMKLVEAVKDLQNHVTNQKTK